MLKLEECKIILEDIALVRKQLEQASSQLEALEILGRLNALYACLDVNSVNEFLNEKKVA